MKKRLIKKLFSVTLTGVIAFGLIACGNNAESAPAEESSPAEGTKEAEGEGETSVSEETGSGEEVTLEWQQWWAVEAPEGYVQNMVDKYYEETGVKVELLSAPFADTKTQIVSGVSTGTVADIVSVDGSWVYDFADQGVLTNMSTLMDSIGFDKSLPASTWDVNGSTYAVPILNFAYPMFANQDILDECGVTELPKTWSDFENVCQKIVDKGYYPYALNLDTSSPSGIQNVYMGFAWASDIKMKNDSGDFDVVNNPELKEYAEWIKSLNDKGYIYPGMSSLTETDMTSKFSSGNICFIINSAAAITAWRADAPDLNLTAAPIPVKDDFTGESAMCVANWSLGITENSEHKEEAMKFIEWLLNAEDGGVCADLAVTQTAFPNSTLAKPDYSNGDPVFQDVYAMYQSGYPYNEFTGMKEANTIMTDYIDELVTYMDGDTDTDTFMNNLQETLDEVYGK